MHSDRNLLIAGAGVTITVGLIVGLFIWPNYKNAAASMRQVDELRSKMELLEGQTQALGTLQSDVALTQQHIDTKLKLIPETPDIASVIRKLSQEVDRVTVLDQTFTAGSPCDAIASAGTSAGKPKTVSSANLKSGSAANDGAPMQAMPLTVDMEASFDSLFALIRSAESLHRLVRITSVRAALSTTKHEPIPGGPPLLKVAVGLEAIYQTSEISPDHDPGPNGATSASHAQASSAEGS